MNSTSDNPTLAPSSNSSKFPTRDLVTPHKICVILLVKQHCHMKEKGYSKTAEENSDFTMAHAKQFCIIALKLMQSPDLDYESVKAILHAKNGKLELSPALLEAFYENVTSLLKDGLGLLLSIMSNTTRLVSAGKGGCAKYSVLGLYLRRILLNFDKMTFAQVVDLFAEFKNYVEPKTKKKNEDDRGHRWTRRELEQFFAREVPKLLNEDPVPLQEKITSILQHNPDFAEAHFLSFLNCLRSKEFCGAKESLHQCFDRTLLPFDKGGNCGEDKSFRYGTLNMAAMHVLFGHNEEALLAIREVMRLSHDAGDAVCLQHVLSWWYHITQDNKDVLFHRAMARCSQLELGYLMSLSIQAYSKFCGLTGSRPTAVFDVIAKSDGLNSSHVLTELPSNAYGVKAALWSLYGHKNLASLFSQQLLRLRGAIHPPFCLALCNVARQLADQGEYQYAVTVLNEAQEMFPQKSSEAWMIAYQEVNFTHLVNQARYNEAAESVTLLGPVKPRECAIRRVWLSHLMGDNLRSMALAQELLQQCDQNWHADPELTATKVRALLAVAACLLPGEAISCLMEALTLAQSFYLHYLAAIIIMRIAANMLDLNLGHRALRLMESALPVIMSHGSVETRGRAFLLLASCRLAVEHQITNKLHLTQTVVTLDTAQEWLSKAQDFIRVKHCWYLKAMIHNNLGSNAERNKCAFEFRQLEEIYPSPSSFFSSY